jgi:hypothetical protein
MAENNVSIPSLVARCQEFGETLGPGWGDLWRRLGIEEAIYPPNCRTPQVAYTRVTS